MQELFRLVVGSIVVLYDSMTLADLATILKEPKTIIRSTLHSLHSLLDVPEEETGAIRVLYPSFGDFILNPETCKNKVFLIDAEAIHCCLLSRCPSRCSVRVPSPRHTSEAQSIVGP